MGIMYELDAIALAVSGGVSHSGVRGSIIGTVIGAMIFGVIISGFTFLRLEAYYQEKAMHEATLAGLEKLRSRFPTYEIPSDTCPEGSASASR